MASNSFANTPKSSGKYKNWESFTLITEKGKVCFAQTKPEFLLEWVVEEAPEFSVDFCCKELYLWRNRLKIHSDGNSDGNLHRYSHRNLHRNSH